MHCASCIWLLENLHRIHPGIISSKANFQRKEVFIIFEEAQTSLRKMVELLAFTGYEPYISLQDEEAKKPVSYNRKYIYRIGVAGFCFGNIMMLSFPEYFSSGNIDQKGLERSLQLPYPRTFPAGIFFQCLRILCFSMERTPAKMAEY